MRSSLFPFPFHLLAGCEDLSSGAVSPLAPTSMQKHDPFPLSLVFFCSLAAAPSTTAGGFRAPGALRNSQDPASQSDSHFWQNVAKVSLAGLDARRGRAFFSARLQAIQQLEEKKRGPPPSREGGRRGGREGKREGTARLGRGGCRTSPASPRQMSRRRWSPGCASAWFTGGRGCTTKSSASASASFRASL